MTSGDYWSLASWKLAIFYWLQTGYVQHNSISEPSSHEDALNIHLTTDDTPSSKIKSFSLNWPKEEANLN